MRGVRRYVREMLAIAGIFVMAMLVAAYILDNQRLRFPWEDVVQIEAVFATAQAVTPGQGQSVNVAGVKVGEISKVTLENGQAVVRMDIDPNLLPAVYPDAYMLIRPKTGLADMSIALDPGSKESGPAVEDGGRISSESTQPNVNPDEVLSALDADSRRYLAVIVGAGGRGLRDKGDELRDVLRVAQPTLRDTRNVTRQLADRRVQLRRLVSNLNRLAKAGADKDVELASLVDSAASTLEVVGGRERALRASVSRLPGALEATEDALVSTRGLTDEAKPALEALRPTARTLSPALVEVRPFLKAARPVLRNDLRPLVRETTPLLRDLRPSVSNLNDTTPELVRTGKVLNYIANELLYNPPGKEEGYLFWTSWFFHNANNILSIEDAHGVAWRGLAMVGCSTIGQVTAQIPAIQGLANAPVCGKVPAP
ncbi:MAG: MCE family protein [Thermoleophilaceae bacterium]|nr:MCE family protein [Thermoleophilaceae bacterium]